MLVLGDDLPRSLGVNAAHLHFAAAKFVNRGVNVDNALFTIDGSQGMKYQSVKSSVSVQ